MKFSFKSGFVLAVACLAAVAAYAEMDQKVLQAAVVTTNTATTTIKGKIDAIGVIIPAVFTSDVTLVSSEGRTLFTLSGATSGTNWYQPRVAIHTTSGTAISSSSLTPYAALTATVHTNLLLVYGSNDTVIATNTVLTYSYTLANTVTTNAAAQYAPLAVVGDVTATFVSAGNTTGTCSVLINFDK